VLFLAMSCLQGRPMDRAFTDLCVDGVDGIQLTPGNQPTEGFAAAVGRSRRAIRTHHGFSYRAFRTKDVWSERGACLVTSDSVHPPRAEHAAAATFLDEPVGLPILETMYPGYALADGPALERAMALGLQLAVDVSHLYIQRTQGVLGDATLARVLDYERIAEVHVSANDGRRDLHAPLTEASFGLAWARQRLAAGTPTILECYFHRLTPVERRAQIDLVRGDLPWPKRRRRKPPRRPRSPRSTSAASAPRSSAACCDSRRPS
jgi:hypothetical protein